MPIVSAYTAFNMDSTAPAVDTTLFSASGDLLEYTASGNTYFEQYAGTFTLAGNVPTGGTISDVYYFSGPTSDELEVFRQITAAGADLDTFNGFLAEDNFAGLYAYLFAGADQFFGSTAADVLNGYTGSDVMQGGGGADVLRGMGGNDTLNGGGGIDSMAGGAGNDILFVNHASDTVIELAGQGTDRINSSVTYTLPANVENLVLTGTVAINGIGNGVANVLTGNGAANVLTGGVGNDTLDGKGGVDTLRGGPGKDSLYGGTGADVFDFNAVSESVPGASRDAIADFGSTDRIDLASIDANTAVAGNQAFTYVTGNAFTSAAQVYYNVSTHILYGNVDADMTAEFQVTVLLSGITNVTSADLVL